MRILVTGAAGFVGGHLVAALAAAGHDLHGTDLVGAPGAGVHRLDLCDRASVIATLEQWPADVVVHAGAISGAMLARDDPQRMFDVNVGGTLSVLEAMRRTGTGRLVHLSSNAVYRSRTDRDPVGEEAALGSDEAYGASKVAAEAIVGAYAARAGIDTWMLRVSSIFGPGRSTPYLISELIDGARSGRPVRVTDARSNMRQLVHVSDVVSALLAAIADPAGGCIAVNVASAEYLPELAIAQIAGRHLSGLKLEVVADKGIEGDGHKGPLDLSRARQRWGWAPRTGIEQGLAELLGTVTDVRTS